MSLAWVGLKSVMCGWWWCELGVDGSYCSVGEVLRGLVVMFRSKVGYRSEGRGQYQISS